MEKHLRERVQFLGGMCIKFKDPARRGAPDRLVLLCGAVCFVELKRPRRGVVGDHQRRYHTALRALGQEVLLIRNKAEVDAFVDLQSQDVGQ